MAQRVYRESARQAKLIMSMMPNPELDARPATKKKRKVCVPPQGGKENEHRRSEYEELAVLQVC